MAGCGSFPLLGVGIAVTSSALSAFLPFSLILDALRNFL